MAVNAIEQAVRRIENITSDDPQFWPRDDFADGALANLGAARAHIAGVISIIKEIGADAAVMAVHEIDHPPFEVEDDDDGIKVLSNAPAHMPR